VVVEQWTNSANTAGDVPKGRAIAGRDGGWPARRFLARIFPPEVVCGGVVSGTPGGAAPTSRLKVKASMISSQWRTMACSERTWKSAQPSSCLAGL
jgi:hypothetical protein